MLYQEKETGAYLLLTAKEGKHIYIRRRASGKQARYAYHLPLLYERLNVLGRSALMCVALLLKMFVTVDSKFKFIVFQAVEAASRDFWCAHAVKLPRVVCVVSRKKVFARSHLGVGTVFPLLRSSETALFMQQYSWAYSS